MSKISEFAAKMAEHNTKIETAVSGLQTDVTDLKNKITELQNSAGEVTPEDQALLDEIETKAFAVADKLEALDGLTPPEAPPAP